MSEPSGIPVVAVRVVVSGTVQGVGFRWHVRESARRESIAGWVRNRTDGTVELLARGEATSVQRLLAAVRAGPPAAQVQDIAIEDTEAVGSLPYPFTVLK